MRMLVVEDDAIVAAHLCRLVLQAGHELVGLAADCSAASVLLKTLEIDFALIDIRLADGMSGLRVAAAARDMGVPFAFTTGNFRLALDDVQGAVGIIAKPYDDKAMIAAIDYLVESLGNGLPAAPPPGLVLSKAWIERLHLGEPSSSDAPPASVGADDAESRP